MIELNEIYVMNVKSMFVNITKKNLTCYKKIKKRGFFLKKKTMDRLFLYLNMLESTLKQENFIIGKC